jgi:predicted O-methyltransferase YrrM
MHSNRNVMFELECAWRHLADGGVIVVDDIDANPAFDAFTKAHPHAPSFICTAEPLAPDMRRFNQKGLFGIICKQL